MSYKNETRGYSFNVKESRKNFDVIRVNTEHLGKLLYQDPVYNDQVSYTLGVLEEAISNIREVLGVTNDKGS